LEFKTVTFVTLTYPRDFPKDAKVYKAHLREYRRRFEIRWGKIQAVWRLEFQRRGAPHYHIFYLDCPFIPVREWCALWSDVIHTNSENHRKIGVDVKLVADRTAERLIAFYVGKYVAKVNGENEHGNTRKCGRWWGRWNIIEKDSIETEITDRQAELLCNFALACRRGGASWEPIDPTLCTIFGSNLGDHYFSDLILGYTNVIRGAGG
jgi:hypothetical protein